MSAIIELTQVLWDATESGRRTVSDHSFRDYALTFIFYKYLSDRYDREIALYQERFAHDSELFKSKLRNMSFIIPQGCSFRDIYDQQLSNNIGELINIALGKIESENSYLQDIFSLDFNSQAVLGSTQQRTKLLRELINSLNKIDLSNANNNLAEAFTLLLRKFRRNEPYPPPLEMRELLAKLSKPFPGNKICDPTCRFGGMLLLAAKEIEKKGSKDYALYGQEKSRIKYNLARMNMILHGKDAARIEWGDVLHNPLLVENGKLMQFDIVISLAPLTLSRWRDGQDVENDKYSRFERGVPPDTKSDYAFILHALEIAKPRSGRVVIAVRQGVLFRSSIEGQIRSKILKENLLDAVITLPPNLFPSTKVPLVILIFDKSREKGGINEASKEVMFIDASREFLTGKTYNILSEEHIEKICKAYIERQNVKQFAYIASLEEIADNDFNLNIARYVGLDNGERVLDVVVTKKRLFKMEKELRRLELQVKQCLAEIDEMGCCDEQ